MQCDYASEMSLYHMVLPSFCTQLQGDRTARVLVPTNAVSCLTSDHLAIVLRVGQMSGTSFNSDSSVGRLPHVSSRVMGRVGHSLHGESAARRQVGPPVPGFAYLSHVDADFRTMSAVLSRCMHCVRQSPAYTAH